MYKQGHYIFNHTKTKPKNLYWGLWNTKPLSQYKILITMILISVCKFPLIMIKIKVIDSKALGILCFF